jgi:hypothetical protein
MLSVPAELRPILSKLREGVVKQYGERARASTQHCEAAEMETAEQRYVAIAGGSQQGGAGSRMESLLVDPSVWRQVRKDFDDLGARQLATLQQDTHPKWLKAYCSFSPEFGGFGKCRIVGGFDGRLISDFEDIATRGACGLGCPPGVEPVGFWLYCLAQSLLRASKPEIRREFSPGNVEGGYIQGLLDSSAGYCSRLAAKAERQASDARFRSERPPDAPADRDQLAPVPGGDDLGMRTVETQPPLARETPKRRRGPLADKEGHRRIARLLPDGWERDLPAALQLLDPPADGGPPLVLSLMWSKKYNITMYREVGEAIGDKEIRQHLERRRALGLRSLADR